MESENDLHESLRTADRAAAAPWVDYPPTPWWYFPAAGCWFAAMAAVVGGVGDNHVVDVIVLVIALVAYGACIGWYRRYRGVMPHGKPPREFWPAIGWYLVGAAAFFVVVWFALQASIVLGTVLAFVLATGGLAAYEVAYARAANRTRSRLG